MTLSEADSAQVLAALQAGKKIEAIKLLLDATGLGLAEAKALADALEQDDVDTANEILDGVNPDKMVVQDPDDRLAPIVKHLGRNNKIEAIKALREQTGGTLKEAKDAVEAFASGRPEQLLAMLREPQRQTRPQASAPMAAPPGLPGLQVTEVGAGSTGGVPKWLLGLLIGLALGAAAVWFLR